MSDFPLTILQSLLLLCLLSFGSFVTMVTLCRTARKLGVSGIGKIYLFEKLTLKLGNK